MSVAVSHIRVRAEHVPYPGVDLSDEKLIKGCAVDYLHPLVLILPSEEYIYIPSDIAQCVPAADRRQLSFGSL